MERWLNELWYGGGTGASALAPLSWLYGTAMRLRERAYATGRLEVVRAGAPVVVVGNLTVGGTGKTPLVVWLAERLTQQGLRVGIVSRGHGRSGRRARLVHARSRWHEVGDEPLLLHERTGCPVVVGHDRAAAAGALVRQGADVVLSDDGLQHLRMARDCEIAVIDAARGIGNGRLLPAGPLREPLARLTRVDFVVVNGEAADRLPREIAGALPRPPAVMRLVPEGLVPLAGGAAQPLEAFRGRRVHAVAGIGNPGRFFGMLRAAGLEPIEHPFPDHHPFTASDLEFSDTLPVIMTEKDAVKCRTFAQAHMWYVPVRAHLGEQDARELLAVIAARLSRSPAKR